MSKALVFLTVPCVSLYRWVHFSRAVLFCQPHQQLFPHSSDLVQLYIVSRTLTDSNTSISSNTNSNTKDKHEFFLSCTWMNFVHTTDKGKMGTVSSHPALTSTRFQATGFKVHQPQCHVAIHVYLFSLPISVSFHPCWCTLHPNSYSYSSPRVMSYTPNMQ